MMREWHWMESIEVEEARRVGRKRSEKGKGGETKTRQKLVYLGTVHSAWYLPLENSVCRTFPSAWGVRGKEPGWHLRDAICWRAGSPSPDQASIRRLAPSPGAGPGKC
ncbi:hypothetical protein CFAM422_010264 [Trichoderma lentiforme]|uniref:Uncharacterized protein n=1 Tax=Trichoderma lentiforme TaxID=1567552 RepID=A0A9P5C9T5_9HYPO|nr:hypothetical protein CFAM422_010264 [Trichoderma lentiforme]